MPRITSNAPYEAITDAIWPKILEGTKIYWDEVVLLMIEQQLLLPNHPELVSEKADPRDRHFYKAKENVQFNSLNRYLTTMKYYRAEKQSTAGTRTRLNFINEGKWQLDKLALLPGRTVREFQYRSNVIQEQPDVTDDTKTYLEKYGNVIQMFDVHSKAVILPHQQKEPVAVEQEKPKQRTRKQK